MKLIKIGATLLLSTGMLIAQSTTGVQTNVGGATDKNEPLYKGCLSGTKNNYTLTTESGQTFRLHSDKDIDDHLNKKVEVRGTQKKEGADRSPSSTKAIVELDVADIKSLNETCSASSASMNSASNSTVASTGQNNAPCNTVSNPAQPNSNTTASATVPSTTSTTTASAGTSATAAGTSLPQADQPSTDVGGSADADEPLFKGCVTGAKKSYTLNADNGDKYRLHSDKDINEHVGNRVEIRGTLKPEGENRAKAGSMWKGELDVADIKTVSKGGCSK